MKTLVERVNFVANKEDTPDGFYQGVVKLAAEYDAVMAKMAEALTDLHHDYSNLRLNAYCDSNLITDERIAITEEALAAYNLLGEK